MCFGGGGKPTYVAPPAPPLPDPAPPPPAPVQPIIQEPIKTVEQGDVGIKAARSKRAQSGSLSKGSSSLRIPLNTGGSGGGLNL